MPKDLAQNLHQKGITHLALCSVIIFLLYLSISNLNHYLSPTKVLGVKTSNELIEEKKFWEKIVKDSPTYQDGWIELSETLIKLDENDYAIGAFNTAKKINPNTGKIIRLEKKINLRR